MYIRKFEPINNSNRFKKKVVSFNLNSKKFKRLVVGKIFFSGRFKSGKKIFSNKGFKNKNLQILLDLKRSWTNLFSLCINIIKSSNSSCYSALIKYSNGTFSYILASNDLKPGSFTFTSIKPLRFLKIKKLNCFVFLRYLNSFFLFFNVELLVKQGSKYAKSAGTFCKLLNLNFEKNTAKIILPTNTVKIVSIFCFVTLGKSSNLNHKFEFLSKAGYNRNKGFKSSVRGVAMNPIDHPHGGRTKTSSPELTPWGKIAKHNK